MVNKGLKLLLLSVPFIEIFSPPAGIGALKGYLTERGYSVDVEHLSLQLYKTIGEPLYNRLAQLILSDAIYASFLFPSKDRFINLRKAFFRTTNTDQETSKPIGREEFDGLINSIEKFNCHIENTLLKKKYDVVGFTTVSNQLLASLYFSKRYKEIHPKAIIVFGGAQSHGDPGRSFINTFPWLDYVVDGEGEETFVEILESIQHKTSRPIDGCSGRIEGRVSVAPHRRPISSLDSLPMPNYDDFFDQLNLHDIHPTRIGIPIQTSRGCWWSKCAFCSLRCPDGSYRKFSPQRIRHVMEDLADRHGVLFFRNVDLIQYQPIHKLSSELIRSHKKVRFSQEIRAGLSLGELRALKEAGLADIQLGVESLCTSLLKKMDKGTTAIQNIQMMKFIKQLRIQSCFNFIVGFPGETSSDFRESIKAIKKCWHLVNDFEESHYELENASHMAVNPKHYRIRNIRPEAMSKYLFPQEYHEKLCFQRLDFDTTRPVQGSYRAALKGECWRGSDEPFLTYEDGGDFIVINDYRREDQGLRLWFDQYVRDIYMYCDRIRTLDEIRKKFTSLSSGKISRVLEKLCKETLMFKENDSYISLAIPHQGH